MKRLLIAVLLSVSLLLVSCGNSSNTSKGNPDNYKSAQNSEKTTDVSTIADVKSWNHPVKEVLSKNNIEILKIDLLKEKTYPVFYVKLPHELSQGKKDYFINLFTEIAKANGFWDYELVDIQKNAVASVKCDKQKQTILDVTVNDKVGYFNVEAPTKNSIENSPAQIRKLGRKDTGLDTITKIDFSTRKLNSRISELLGNRNLYIDKDFSNGIDISNYYNAIIITERYKDSILEGLKIGDEIEQVRSVLSKPCFEAKGCIFYKTNKYYLGFKGAKNIEQVIFQNNPGAYDVQVLKNILKGLEGSKLHSLSDVLQNNDKLPGFFEKMGHINGGGLYANSMNGIEITDFFEDSNVTVYNNFEGDVYSFADDKNKYTVKYINEDSIVNNMVSDLNNYIEMNKRFEKEGQLSPNGKYKFLYDWVYSMSQYFTIRTVDLSKPDFRLPANASDYKWLSDDYILYIHGWASIPYILKVSDHGSEHVNILCRLGISKDNDYGEYIGKYQYQIKDVKGNTIRLYDDSSNTELNVDYSFDSQNNVVLKKK